MVIKTIVMGECVAKQSARFANIGGFIKSYQKSKVTNYANFVKMCFIEQHPNHCIDDLKGKMLQIHIKAYRMIPLSKPKRFKEQASMGVLRPITKPDTDNIAKNIKDALNKIAYPDDSQIVKEIIEKFYSYTPRVEIEIKEFEGNDNIIKAN